MKVSFTPEIKTELGALRGFIKPGKQNPMYCFYGIPYAEAPVGDLRWRDAQEKHPWNGLLDCTAPLTEQKSSYQWGTELLPYFETLNQSEDCLYLNITTPDLRPDSELPVIVWFHGGGLFGGSGSEEIYNLPYLPEKGCVLVTVSTRLGAFGLLSSDILGSRAGTAHSGNFILSDMLEALRWVKKNIAHFGGAPDNVTIAGESGGSQKVSAIMTVPAAAGLFSKSIMQSGTATTMTFEEAKQAGNQLMEKLGVDSASQARELPAEFIVQAYNELEMMSDFIVDGYYLPMVPIDAFAFGRYCGCNVIMSVNAGEVDNILPIAGGLPGYLTIMNQLTSDGFSAYAYVLDQVPATWRTLGFQCVHSMDLAYLFGEYEDNSRFYSGGPWVQQFLFHGAGEKIDQEKFISPAMDKDDRWLSTCIMELWGSFAAHGVPIHGEVPWGKWTARDHDYLLLSKRANTHPSMEKGFDRLKRK